MNKMRKISKIIACAFVACIIIIGSIHTLINTTMVVQAAEYTVGNSSYKYCVNGTYINIVKYTGTDAEVVIPDMIEGKPVKTIMNHAFDGCNTLTSVSIPGSVKDVGRFVFAYCKNLTSVNIQNGVTSIEHNAFEGCSSLTSVNIPSSVTSIGSDAFWGCSSLSEINVAPDSEVYKLVDGVLFNKEGTELVLYPAGKTDEKYDIPSSVTSIGECAFAYNGSLTSVSIPNSVTSIKSDTFSCCSNLTSVSIPSSVTSIGSYAFYNCNSLTSISIPNSVTSIGSCAFQGCSSLTRINIPSSVTNIKDYALGYIYNSGYIKMDDFTIIGSKDSEAENYAIKNEFKFIDIAEETNQEQTTETTDMNTTEEPVFDENAKVVDDHGNTVVLKEVKVDVTAATDEVMERANKVLTEKGVTIAENAVTDYFDINLVANNTVVKLSDGIIQFTVPKNSNIDAEKYTVRAYHIKDDDSYEEIPAELTADGVKITASSFSPYVVVYEVKAVEPSQTEEQKQENLSPATGDAANVYAFVMVAVLAAGVMAIGFKKKRA